MKVILLIFVVAILAIGGTAAWHEYSRNQHDAEVRRQIKQADDKVAAAWKEHLDALARLRPLMRQLDANYPTVTALRKCPADVAGEVPFHARTELRALIAGDPSERHVFEDPPYKPNAGWDIQAWEKSAYWVVHVIEAQRQSQVKQDKTLERGAARGSVVVFDTKTQKPLCEAPVDAYGSEAVTTSVRVRVQPNGEHVQMDSSQGKLQEAAAMDLNWNWQYAVGDAMDQIAPAVKRPIVFYRR
jgi:hypothetical protein